MTLKRFVKLILLIVTPIIIGTVIWSVRLYVGISERIQNGWFPPPIEIYAPGIKLQAGQYLAPESFKQELKDQGFIERQRSGPLQESEFEKLDLESCQRVLPEEIDPLAKDCYLIRPKKPADLVAVVISIDASLKQLYSGEPLSPTSQVSFRPTLLAQEFEGQLMSRKYSPLSAFPLLCLQGITAIEDKRFLEHSGVSLSGTLRGVYGLITGQRELGGGSTITQQLVKNYFLTSERTISRKATEIIMALILEAMVDKDTILENYLNVIYMGQNGPFQVRGFAAAAENYFSKPVEKLELHECAFLAGLLNNPGWFSPFRKDPSPGLQRRERVLEKMLENGFITDRQKQIASSKPLPKRTTDDEIQPAPYFIDAIRKDLRAKGVDLEQGIRVFSTIDLRAQKSASKALNSALNDIVNRHETLKIKEKGGQKLQAMVLSADIKTGQVIALIGGRDFRTSPFNRAIDAHRQVGSIMKPIVYLTALETLTESGTPYSPMTVLTDEPWTYKYDRQSWSPVNYDDAFRGPIPLFWALKNSINVPTAKLGISVGLESIIDTAKRIGVTSPLKPFPAITLGAFELYPMEVLTAYLTIARFGSRVQTKLYTRVETLDGRLILEPRSEQDQVLSNDKAAQLVGMMKNTLASGTAQSARAWGFSHTAAGKTGTTSDSRDAWFAGFTPNVLTLVWVGYDNNNKHGLTGASGALPIWSLFMRDYLKGTENLDFQWPETVEAVDVSKSEIMEIVGPELWEKVPEKTELVFPVGER